jgi:ATP/maltotriose-dependent transcriptional regulator MalT/CheY-like chemotaxis protein
MPTTILLVDDHPVFRKGLRILFEDEQDIQVVGEAGDGQEAIDRVRDLSPDVVVMDINMPNFNGIEATRQIVSDFPDTKIIALSIHSGKRFIEDMLSAGAVGYILKECAPEELVNGVRSVMRDEIYLSPSVTGIVVSEFVTTQPTAKATGDHDWGATDEKTPIIHTKLHRPPIPKNHVDRPRLLKQFEKDHRKPLTLVSAPAGYGKSILLSFWLENCDCPNAWYSLDESDNSLRQFLIYFLSAIRTMFPDAVEKTLALANSSNLPPMKGLVASLLNEMNLIDQDYILAIDDIHLVQEKQVHDLFTELLRYPPKRMHLALSGRRDPFLPIPSLRSQELVTEIRLQDLCFNTAETKAYLEQVLEDQIEDAIAAKWTEKTEGWITGLHLAALSIYHRGDAAGMLSEMPGGLQYVTEYLFSEVFERQSPEIRHYLLSTAILDRFCTPLCDVLYGLDVDSRQADISSWDFINLLKKENLFIINLDAENRWFRYHHLFKQLLQNQLKRYHSPEEISALHSRAGQWFAENGLIDEAIQYFLAGGDFEAAGRLVSQHGHTLIDEERVADLERWLHLLPHKIVENTPMLLIFKAWIWRVKLQITKVVETLDQVEALLREDPPSKAMSDCIWGYLNTLRTYQHFYMLDCEKAQTCAKRAVTLIPPEYGYMRSFAVTVQGAALQMAGRFLDGLSVLNSALAAATLKRSHNQGILLNGVSKASMMEAAFPTQRTAATSLLRLGKEAGLPVYLAWGRMNLACSHYQCNEVEEAKRILASYMEDRHLIYPDAVGDGAAILVLSCQVLNQPQEALDVANLINEFAMEIGNTRLVQTGQALQAELALRQGRMAEAVAWARMFETRQLRAHYFFYLPEFTQAWVLVAEDTPDSRQRAQKLLLELEAFSRNTHNRSVLIPVLALQANLLDRKADESAALEKLAEAVSLAEPGGGIRFFLDQGTPMAELLKRLLKQNIAVDFIGKILAAFGDEEPEAVPDASDHEGPSPHHPPILPVTSSSRSQPLVEPLTNRELDILDLLAQRLQNKEIADKLFISTETVKSHLNNIYQKLNVSNRRDAVEKAKSLGIL